MIKEGKIPLARQRFLSCGTSRGCRGRSGTIGEGVFGNAFVYTSPRADWRAVSWQWPVRRGAKVEHERLVLIAASDARPAELAEPSSGSAFNRVLSLLDWRSSGHDANPRLTRALQRVAARIVLRRIEAAA